MENRDRFPVVVHLLIYRKPVEEGEAPVQFALLKRANTGFMDGYYALPGGHQHQGESVSQAAARECGEELGIEVSQLTPACVLPYRSGRHQGINFVFACSDYQGTPRINEPELFSELIWAAPDSLPRPCAEWIPEALQLAVGENWFRELEWD